MENNFPAATTEALGLYKTMLRIRMFEEKVLSLFNEGRLRGTTHVCIGQEAVAAGACKGLKSQDYITSNHRGHGHLIARGANLNKMMAELFGKESGYSRGVGGSQHIAVKELNFLGSNGITAGGIPIATGAALKLKINGEKAISVSFTGDGATAQGTFHESLNFAAVKKLPLLLIIENNNYAMSTPIRETCPLRNISSRAAGYDIPSTTIDGNDPLMVESAVTEARARILENSTPYLIEAVTTRLTGHSRSDDCSYIPEGIIDDWHSNDPVKRLEEILSEHSVDEDTLMKIKSEIECEIKSAVEFSQKSNFFEIKEFENSIFVKSSECKITKPTAERNITFSNAINLALDHSLQNDKKVILMGEDIAEYGGAFKVTKGLVEKHGKEKIINTPISENSCIGIATGAAMTGLRPVIEIMFMDFILLALDQIANHAAKFAGIYAGQYRVPLTIRTPAGGRRGYGATHSQSFESLLFSIPGLKIYAPFSVEDAYVLTLEAINDNNPVLLLEHKLLYAEKGDISEKHLPLPAGKAKVLKEGKDLAIISYSYMLKLCLEAAKDLEKNNISTEIIDLRTLNPLDMQTVVESANKTGKAIFVEEGTLTGGIGSEICARIQEECFGYLETPVLRVAAKDTPIPACKELEDKVLPQVSDILDTAKTLLTEY